MLQAIPLAAFAIALLGIYVFMHRESGWMPGRESMASGLRHLKDQMTVEARAPFDAQPVWYAGMVVEPAEFAQQLANLQTSLQRANAPVVRTSTVEAQTVAAR